MRQFHNIFHANYFLRKLFLMILSFKFRIIKKAGQQYQRNDHGMIIMLNWILIMIDKP